MTHAGIRDVLTFWFEAGPERWYVKDLSFDQDIRDRFLALHEQAAEGALAAWETVPKAALALVILLDQFPRNMFRGSARSFATDALAREVAGRAILRGFDREVEPIERQFFYLPLMHSEELADQDHCLALYQANGPAEGLPFAEEHRAIIIRFGRFPHRNPLLGRDTTEEEQQFLDEGGFAG
ncbi:conserved hypothetical protein [Hyphomicrobiales bacterium]|nr:conserved hypothetical protein [Hyphomicrobiales bacterium]CAH1668246.1 conserved hypothetical protein [Hyphomicrobiales bacterium]